MWVKKIPPSWNFWHFYLKRLGIFLVQIYTPIIRSYLRLDCKFLFNYLQQLWRSYGILSATTIMCSKCPPSTETHAGWSHLIWHNFVKVVDNWIRIRTLALIGTHNRHVKFGWKPAVLEKLPQVSLQVGGMLGNTSGQTKIIFWWDYPYPM